ncbi:MAG: GIY-YIG nuclease family protein [Niastella sp.]|nr:GIY-YIG nuclease family protein [Niastella sp.]
MQVNQTYFVYILTNPNKTVLYIGVTNNLAQRIIEHYINRGSSSTFAGRHFCYQLLYYETFGQIRSAIARETEIKKWNRNKKEALIKTMNPDWVFLNKELFGQRPPEEAISHRGS